MSFSKSCLDVFLHAIVFTDETAQVCKVIHKLKWVTIYRDRCNQSDIDVHHLGLDSIDVKACLFGIAVQSISLLL